MEFDIEIACKPVGLSVEQLQTELGHDFIVVERTNSKYFFLRTKDSKSSNTSIGAALSNFLNKFETRKEFFPPIQANLRVGVFFDVDAVAFPYLEFSASDLRRLAELNLSLELSIYPCDDETSSAQNS
jgi:hypothetical protein